MKLHAPPNRNASLEKASRILFAFDEETSQLGVMDIARRVGLNKSTVSRFVASLTELGLLERVEGGRKVRLSLDSTKSACWQCGIDQSSALWARR